MKSPIMQQSLLLAIASLAAVSCFALSPPPLAAPIPMSAAGRCRVRSTHDGRRPSLEASASQVTNSVVANEQEPTVELLEAWTREYMANAKESSNNVTAWLDDDYVQTGPDIGPLNKADYENVWNTYKEAGMNFQEAIPNLEQRLDGFHLDPHNPWRVWFVVRYSGVHTGAMTLPNSDAKLEPTDPPRIIMGGPELFSIWWTPAKKIRFETVGYCGDRYTGTNQGYGAVVGLLIGMGLPRLAVDMLTPITKVQSWYSQFGSIGDGLPRTRTPFKELPKWWRERQELDMNFRN